MTDTNTWEGMLPSTSPIERLSYFCVFSPQLVIAVVSNSMVHLMETVTNSILIYTKQLSHTEAKQSKQVCFAIHTRFSDQKRRTHKNDTVIRTMLVKSVCAMFTFWWWIDHHKTALSMSSARSILIMGVSLSIPCVASICSILIFYFLCFQFQGDFQYQVTKLRNFRYLPPDIGSPMPRVGATPNFGKSY